MRGMRARDELNADVDTSASKNKEDNNKQSTFIKSVFSSIENYTANAKDVGILIFLTK